MIAKSPLAYGVPVLFVPLLMVGWWYGGIFILLAPIFGYVIITLFDFVVGESNETSVTIKRSILNYKQLLEMLELALKFILEKAN